MPTLEPSREGFTQSGSPSASQRPPPAVPRRPRRSRPGGCRARRRGASGSACPCRPPRRGRRSRRRGRRATRAGPGRCRPRRRGRAGPGRRRRRRAGRRRDQLDRLAAAAPAPVARDRHLDRPRGRPRAARAATEAPERSETSCSEERPPREDRDPHGLSSRSFGVVGGSRGPLADDDRHRRRPVRARSPAAGTGRSTRPILRLRLRFLLLRTVGAEAGAAQRPATASERSLPITFGTFTFCFPEETTIATVEPGFDLGCRRWATGGSPRPPAASLSSSVTLGVRPRPRICCTATRALGADQDRDLGRFGPLETKRVTVGAVGRGLAGGGFGVDHLAFFDRVRVDGFDLDARSPPSSSFFVRFVARQPARSPAPCRCPGRS